MIAVHFCAFKQGFQKSVTTWDGEENKTDTVVYRKRKKKCLVMTTVLFCCSAINSDWTSTVSTRKDAICGGEGVSMITTIQSCISLFSVERLNKDSTTGFDLVPASSQVV